MPDLLHFAGLHPWLAWGLSWGLWPAAWVAVTVIAVPFQTVLTAYNRHLRSKNIAAAGWPDKPLMDADGDIVHPPKGEA